MLFYLHSVQYGDTTGMTQPGRQRAAVEQSMRNRAQAGDAGTAQRKYSSEARAGRSVWLTDLRRGTSLSSMTLRLSIEVMPVQ